MAETEGGTIAASGTPRRSVGRALIETLWAPRRAGRVKERTETKGTRLPGKSVPSPRRPHTRGLCTSLRFRKWSGGESCRRGERISRRPAPSDYRWHRVIPSVRRLGHVTERDNCIQRITVPPRALSLPMSGARPAHHVVFPCASCTPPVIARAPSSPHRGVIASHQAHLRFSPD
ncbi:hypothetical protein NDU88_004592 [Pleurodeles waltl]|uniref:Uncharacterized protein n=1 Tax=Pleurodeles waltl TaxID=8319 RepID=A0AAV7L1W1_PLEWA|nr:hypothetical protein NDU88_004592 [Pleurodeles waltl]